MFLRDGPDIDLSQLAALRHACAFDDRPLAELAAMVTGARFVVSAWEGDTLVGFARALSDDVTTAYVSSVMVAPTHRRLGLGRALLARLTEGRSHLKFVLHARPEARAFYEAVGFRAAADMYVRPRG